jgi:two-component sensor histidine kinase
VFSSGTCVIDNVPPIQNSEDKRVEALKRYGILDTPREPEFDDLVTLASKACDTPIALISLLDSQRQWFKAEVGLGVRETPLVVSICAKAILEPGLFVVPDTTKDERFDDNPLVEGEPHLRFYAGSRLETPEGVPLGTLCVLDTRPRDLTEDQRFTLRILSRQVMAQLELRRAVAERDSALIAIRQAEQRQSLLVRELHHRIRNTLAMVQALLGSTARSAKSIEQFSRAFAGRIASIAETQGLLTEDYWQTASLEKMLKQELRRFTPETQDRVVMRGPPLDLSADLAVPVGMALHELTSNAVRHGALSVGAGHVEVRWDLRQVDGARKLHLEWTEFDGPLVQEPERKGFGSTLLQRVLAMQANGEVKLQFDPTGVRFEMEAPLVEKRLVPKY